MIKNNRIAFIIGTMKRGGAERVVSLLANYYIKKNWEVDIILLLGNEIEYELDPNINIILLSNDKKTRIGQLPNWIYGMRTYMKNYKPTTVLSFIARINIITAISSIGLKLNIVVSERNDPSKDGRSIFVRLATEYVYRRVNHVVFQTKEAQSYFSESVKANSTIIYNPISVPYKTRYSPGHIVSVGRLERQKNHKLLIKSFKSIHHMYPNYTLTIYGEGTLRNELERLIDSLGLNGSVFLPGNVQNIHEKLTQKEIFVLSSDYEGLSNALLEAMTMGMPCISTNCAGSKEIIESGKNGLLIPIGDEKKMVKAMKLLIENKNFAKELGREARKKSKYFSSDLILKEWEKILEEDLR